MQLEQKLIEGKAVLGTAKIDARRVKFDQTYLAAIRARGLPDYAFCSQLSGSGQEVRLAEIRDSSDSRRGVGENAYYLASEALRTIGVKGDRPLIVVSGGCKEIAQEGLSQIDTVTRAVIKAA